MSIIILLGCEQLLPERSLSALASRTMSPDQNGSQFGRESRYAVGLVAVTLMMNLTHLLQLNHSIKHDPMYASRKVKRVWQEQNKVARELASHSLESFHCAMK